MDTYTPKQFARSLFLRGYCTEKQARLYVQYIGQYTTNKTYTEEDFEEAYRYFNKEYMRSNPIRGLTSDGQNRLSASASK